MIASGRSGLVGSSSALAPSRSSGSNQRRQLMRGAREGIDAGRRARARVAGGGGGAAVDGAVARGLGSVVQGEQGVAQRLERHALGHLGGRSGVLVIDLLEPDQRLFGRPIRLQLHDRADRLQLGDRAQRRVLIDPAPHANALPRRRTPPRPRDRRGRRAASRSSSSARVRADGAVPLK